MRALWLVVLLAAASPELNKATAADATVPLKPSTLTVTAGSGQVTLNWTSGGDGGSAITGWEYRYWVAQEATVGGIDWTAISGSGATTTSHTITGLYGGVKINFQVRAVNSKGKGTARSTAYVTLDATEPAAPSTPHADAGDRKVALRWGLLSDGGGTFTRWEYARKDGSNAWGSWTTMTGVDRHTRQYDFTGLTNGTEYKFKVRAVNASGTGDASPESNTSTPRAAEGSDAGLEYSVDGTGIEVREGSSATYTVALVAAPSANVSVSVSTRTASDADVTVAPATLSFTTNNWSTAQTVTVSAAQDTDNTADKATIYHSVTSTDTDYSGLFVHKIAAVVIDDDCGPPEAATLTATVVGSGVVLAWTPGGDGSVEVLGWQYRRGGGAWTDIAGGGAARSLVLLGLTRGTHSFEVRAVGVAGWGPASVAASASLTTDLAASDVKESSATLTVSGHAGAWWHKGDQADATCSRVTGTSASVAGLKPGRAYVYKAYSAAGCNTDLVLLGSAAFTTPKLTAEGVTRARATLRFAGGPLRWWYRGNRAPHAGCSSAVLGRTAELSGLAGSATYTYKAYGKAGCAPADELASVGFAALTDYDADGDGLVEIATLEQLNAVRWDLDGDGDPASGRATDYAAAFPDAVSTPGNLGCPAAHCAGYELAASLDFASASSYASGTVNADWSAGANDSGGWTPLGGATDKFRGEFDGNGRAVANLYIDRSGSDDQGLFGVVGAAGEVLDLGVVGASVRGGARVGALAGDNEGAVRHCWSGTGSGEKIVATKASAGGLVGRNKGTVAASRSTAAVDLESSDRATHAGNAGGLVGETSGASAKVAASWAGGAVDNDDDVSGGLVGLHGGGAVTASHAIGPVTLSNGAAKGGLIGSAGVGATVAASYWDAQTTGVPDDADVLAPEGRKTSELKAPTGYSGLYATWNVDVDGATGGDDPWHFGGTGDYPRLKRLPRLDGGGFRATGASLIAGTLSLSNWSAAWWYRADKGPDASCSSEVAAGTAEAGLAGLSIGETYAYKAYLDAACALEVAATEFFLDPVDVGVPPAPGKPTAAAAHRSVALGWTSNGGGDSPIVEWQYAYKTTAGYGDWIAIPNSGASTTGHTVDGLANGTAHRFKVRAVNTVGAGTASPESDAATPAAAAPPAPGKPTAAAGNASVALGWRSHGDGGEAIIRWEYVKKTGAGAWETTWKTIPGGGSARRHAVASLVNSTEYRFKVRGVNAVGDGAASPESDAATPALQPALSAAATSATAATLTLANHAGDWWYRADKGPDASCSASKVPQGTSTKALTGLTAGAEYAYAAYSDSGCATALASAALAMPELGAEAVRPTTATLRLANWGAAWRYKATAGGGPDTGCSAAVGSGTSTAGLTGLTLGTTYTYAAYSDDACAASKKIDDATFTAAKADYDADGDGLVEIATLEQLNAVRWDLDGNGAPVGDAGKYALAFPDAASSPGNMGCPATHCKGYELAASLDFDDDASYASPGTSASGNKKDWTTTPGWIPIGTRNAGFSATFEGNGRVVANLFIDRSADGFQGLFGQVHRGGEVSRVGVPGASVKGKDNVGALAGRNSGKILHSWSSTGPSEKIEATEAFVGGLVGQNDLGSGIAGSRSSASVSLRSVDKTKSGASGGLVGRSGGPIQASHASGDVFNDDDLAGGLVGGLIGGGFGAGIDASYATGPVTLQNGTAKGGLVGENNAGADAISDSYWDSDTTGIDDDLDAAAPEGRGTAALRAPTGYAGIYADWNVDLLLDTGLPDGDSDDPWHFGGERDYPRLKRLPRLDVGDFKATGASLTLSRWDEPWFHKADAGLDASCSPEIPAGTAPTVATELKPGTTVAYGAYLDAACSVELARTTAALPGLRAVPGAATTATLELSDDWTGAWWYRADRGPDASCSPMAAGTTTASLTGLTRGLAYAYAAYRAAGCAEADRIAGVAFSVGAPTLGWSTGDADDVTLTLTGWDRTAPPFGSLPWWYKGDHAGAQCSAAPVGQGGRIGNEATLRGFRPLTRYVYTAYRESQCATGHAIARVSFTSGGKSYDADGDGLVEIATLEQLNAVRWDLDGDGSPSSGNEADYAAAFPGAVSSPGNMGCPTGGCDGYELAASLDFAAASSYASGTVNADWSAGANSSGGWTPLGGSTEPFAATFDGNGLAVANLYIDRSGSDNQGLFGALAATAEVLGLGVPSASVRGSSSVGALAGENRGTIRNSWSTTGPSERILSGWANAGGLVGVNRGSVASSRAAAYVVAQTGSSAFNELPTGGLVGLNAGSGRIVACHAGGRTVETSVGRAGGLVGRIDGGSILASYSTGFVTGPYNSVRGGLIGGRTGGTVSSSYWDSQTSRIADDSDTAAPEGRKTAELRAPTGYAGLYQAWNVDLGLDGDFGDGDSDDPWYFGGGDYPRLKGLPRLEAVSGVGARATLRLSNWSGAWWYKADKTPHTGCSAKVAAGTATRALAGLRVGQTYRYTAYLDDACSMELASVAFATAPTSPSAPSKPTATAGDRQAALAWTAGADGGSPVIEWQVSRKAGDGAWGAWKAVPGGGASTTGHTATGLTNGTKYRFKVRAVNVVGTGAASPASDAATPALALASAPPAPDKPVAVAGDRSAAVTWESNGDGGSAITRWEYVKKAGPAAWETTWTAIAGSGPSTTGYTVTGLVNGTAYRFKVRAVNVAGDGAESPASDAATPAPAPVLAAAATSGAAATLTLSNWSAAWRYKADKAPHAACSSEVAANASANLTGLTSGERYAYAAYGDSGCAAKLAEAPLAMPDLSAAVDGGAGTATLTLSNWSALWHYKATVGGGPDANCSTAVPANTPTRALSGLTTGTTYTYKAYSDSACGGSNELGSATFTAGKIDYDADDNGLVEITTLEQLNAVRWDLDGDGSPSSGNESNHASAFPHAASTPGNLGCPASDCAGYELAASLDFDDDASYADTSNKSGWTTGTGWTPLGDSSTEFTTTFDGNGRAVANLFINRNANLQGLFGELGGAAEVLDLGVAGASVSGGSVVGALAGQNQGTIRRSWSSTGPSEKIQGNWSNVGGLVGVNRGNIAASRSAADVSITRNHANVSIGGLVGQNFGRIVAGDAFGAVAGGTAGNYGGLAGYNNGGSVAASYAAGAVTGTGNKGGLVGDSAGTATVSASYWDTATTGIADDIDTAAPEGRTTAELQSPTGYSGIYADWNADLGEGDDDFADGDKDDPWHFGGADDYPRLNGLPRLDAGGHAVSGVSLTATLTLSNWGGDWWYKADKAPHASCSSKVAAGTGTASLSGLKATDSYAYAAYMDSGCALMLAAAPVSGASAVTLDATGVTEASARLSISASYSGQWWYKGSQATATCTSVADGVRSVDLSSLESGATLTYRAYGKSGCASADELGSVDFSTPELEASAVAETSATLTLANHSGPWWYKGTETNAACKSVESGTAASLSDLAGGESHSYAAYARAGCASVARIARVTFNTLRDYDADGDGLVEIATLEQLNAVRWDLDGDGSPSSGNETSHAAAFPDAVSTPGNLGCPAAHCAGYELAASLDFASASSYASGTVNADWSAGANDSGGWTPLGGATDKFRGEFDGNGRAVANLYIDRSGSDDQGLFGVVGAAGEVLDLGVVGASVRGGARVGALAGDNEGAVRHCWSGTGSGEKIVATKASAGGLVGRNKGTVAASRSTAAVDLESSDRATHAGNAGGLVGETSGASAKVAASWAGGAVDNDDDVSGGLVGLHGGGSVSASHAIGPVTLTNGTAKGGLVGSAGVGATVAASYWDALTTGVPDDADNLAPEGRKTSELTAPTGYSGPYASWNVDVDGVTGVDDPWHFGGTGDYPRLKRLPRLDGGDFGASGGKATATLSLSNWAGAWRYRADKGPDAASCSPEVAAGTGEAALSGLAFGASYAYRAYLDAACAVEVASTTVAAPGLDAGDFTSTGATLTLLNWSGDWWYKADEGPDANCSPKVAAGTNPAPRSGLTPGATYRYSAYGGAGCGAADLIAVGDSFATLSLVASAVLQARATLTLSNWGEAWWYKVSVSLETASVSGAGAASATCKAVAKGTSSVTLSNLAAGRTYAMDAYSDGACATKLASASFATPKLTASAVEATTATLTIANHKGSWHYKYTAPTTPAGTCSAAVAGTSANLASLATGTTYTFKAYGDGACADLLATAADFTTKPGKVAGVGVAARDGALYVDWTAETGATSYKIQWKSGAQTWDAATRQDTSTVVSATLSPLANATDYTVRVAATTSGGDGAWSDEATGTPAAETLTVSAIASTGATLTIGSYGGAWYYKHTTPATGPGASCSATAVPAGTDKTTVSGLSPDTAHVFKAYSDGGCATELATASSFTTLMAKVSNVSVSARDKSLAVSWDAQSNATGYDVQWKSGNQDWSSSREASVTSGESHTITTLTNATEYTVRVRSRKSSPANTGEWSDAAKGTPADETLAVSNIASTGATLTIGNYGGAWHYKHTTPATGPGASCSSAVAEGTAAATVPGLAPDTSHVFKAYSDSGCSTLLATAASFTTLMAKVSNVSVSARDRSLAVSWDAQTGATGYDVQWKSGHEVWDAGRQTSASTTAATITGLENGTQYTIRARSKKTTGAGNTGEWSNEATGTPADETLAVSNIASTGATLTIGNYGGSWHYKHTTPSTGPGASCSATAVPAGTDNTTVSGLSPDTAHVFKAYSDSGCATEIAAASSFTTLMAKVSNVSVSARDGSLAVSWDARSNATGYDVEWKSGSEEWDSTNRRASATGASHTIPTLTNAVEYTIRVRSKKSSPANTGEWSDAAKGAPADETLTVSNIGATGATLTIGNYGGIWRYRHTTPATGPGASCSSTAVPAGTDNTTVSGLSPDTSHTFKAYSDGACATELAAAASFTTLLAKVANVSVAPRDGSLAVSWDARTGATGYDVQWKSDAEDWDSTNRQSSVTGTSAAITTLTNDTEYTIRVRSKKSGDPGNTGEWSDEAKGTPADETLTVSNIASTGATLTIGNYGGSWHYKHTTPSSGTCSSAVATASTTVSGLDADTAHVFKAYSDGGCATELAAASSFTTLMAKVSNVSVSARDGALAVSWDARTGATGYDVQWKSDAEDWDSANRQTSATGTAATISTLTNAVEYTIRVRSKKDGNTGEWSDAAKGTPAAETLTVSSIGSTGATLTIGNYGGSWHYRHTTPSSGTCSSAVSTASTTATGLSPDTAHVFKAYSDGNCATELATAAQFTTLMAKVSNVSVSARDGSLAVTWDAQSNATGYDVEWKSGSEEWDSANRRASVTPGTKTGHTIPTLTNAVEYTIRVRSRKTGNTGEWSDAAKGAPADETLTVSAIGATGATLTIGNYGGAWHHKHTTPATGPGASCSSAAVPAGTDNTTVSGLTADTAHVFKAYSDGGCATELAAAASFTTLMAKLANVRVSARDKSLAVSWDAQTGATGYDVQWRSGAEEWDSTNRQSSATGTAATITTLTNGTEYTIRARSKKSGGSGNTGEWSDEATGTPGDERLEATDVRSTTATLALSNWGEAWWWRLSRTASSSGAGGASSASCRAAAKGTAGVSLSSLEAGTEYTANAYSDAACSALLAGATFTTPELSAEDRTATAATLRLSDWAGTWRHKRTAPTEGTCSAEIAAGTETASLSSLTAGRTYAYKAYSDATCASGKEIAEATFTTPKLAAEKIGPDRATLRLTDWSAAWRYKKTAPTPAGTCSAEVAAGTATAALTTLAESTAHVYKAYSDAACASGGEIAEAAFSTPADSMPTFGAAVVADREYVKGADIGALALPAATGGDGAAAYSLAPDLPAGLSFDASLRQITGAPTAARARTTHTYAATDRDGDAATLTFDITVFEGTLSFSATVADRSYTKDAAIAALQLPAAAASTGAPAIAYALAPNLPAGLSFDASTRRITGAPTAASAKQAYALTATAANYSPGTVAFDIEVVLGALSFSAAVSDQSYEANTAIADLVLPAATASTGSPAIAYALTPAPPAGLSFDASTRTLSGAPAAASASAAYTLTATAADYSPATLTFDIAVSADATAPAPASATADGATVSVAFGEALDASSVPPASAFDVRADGWPADLASSGAVSVSGSTLSLSLASAVAAEDRVTVGYAVPASGARLRDAASPANDAAAFSLVASNATADSAKPALAGAAASGTMVALTFGEPLDETSVPPASAFAVEVGGSAAALAAVDPVSVSGRAVSLALAAAAPAGSAVEVDYAKPGTNPIRDAAGNGADAFSAEAEASAAPSLAASDAAPAVATLTLTGRTGAWWLSAADKSGRLWCRAQTGPAAFATGLEGNRTYVFEARAAAGCGAGANAQSSGGALATADLTTPGPLFLAADNVTGSSVSLYLHGDVESEGVIPRGGWWSYTIRFADAYHKGRSCQFFSISGHPSARLEVAFSGLLSGERYLAGMFPGRACDLLDRFATVEFETLAADAGPRPALSIGNVGDDSATLRISNWSGPWWHGVWRKGDDAWSGAACVGVAAGTASAVVSGLDANTTHGVMAWSEAGCGTAPISVEWNTHSRFFTTTGPVSVGVGGVTSSSLELSLDGRAGGGAWSYVVEGPGGSGTGGCRTAAGGATAEVSGLAAGTRHEVYAFDGASCPRLGAPERAGGGSAWDAAAAAEATTAEEGG